MWPDTGQRRAFASARFAVVSGWDPRENGIPATEHKSIRVSGTDRLHAGPLAARAPRDPSSLFGSLSCAASCRDRESRLILEVFSPLRSRHQVPIFLNRVFWGYAMIARVSRHSGIVAS